MRTRTWRTIATERMADPEVAQVYLKLAMQEYEVDGDTIAFLVALRTVVEAKGGIGQLAKETGLNRQTLYRTLAGQHSPRLDTLAAILRFCGLSLSVKPLRSSNLSGEARA